jgi:class 3 adenylate cyclase/tetratricopeptide (TPR) repeat protein
MICQQCQFENPAEAKFCNECGSKLELACPQCSKVNPLGSKFCNECGHNLAKPIDPMESAESGQNQIPSTAILEPTPLPEGERRQATIVFSDLSGYTSMNEKLDPEEVEAIMSRIKKEAVRIVERHEGIVNQFVGDEVLALFGIPTANEDDPVRAVKAAFEIHELVRQISSEVEERIDIKLRMHTGIASGLVVTHIRDIREGSYGITGDTVNIGARLATRADADEIIVGPETYSLIALFFETETLDKVTVRGRAQPLIPYRVKRELAVRNRFEAAEKLGFTEFTGRKQELITLYSNLDKSTAGNGQFVTIAGEAGVGKSRLIYEFRHSLNQNEITVLQGHCQSYGTSIPYFPHTNALKRGLNLHDEDTASELLEKAVSNILVIDQKLERYLPLYLHLLSIQNQDYQLPGHLQGQELKLAIQEALAAIFILNSKKQPMVLILEDWHWTDEASESALKYIVSLTSSHSLMILVIYRPDYSANWGNWSHHTPIILNAFDKPGCEDFIKTVWQSDLLPEGIAGLIHERTGGNPFFIEEICNAFTEDGTVQIKDRQAILTHSLENITLPKTVQAVIRARLDRLDRNSRESLRLASVIGREFTRRILEQISSSREQLSQSLEELKLLELIQQIRVIPEAEYMFKHIITQEVTYETLLHKKRKELHDLVGRAIEELYQDRIEDQVNLLYRHFSQAANWPKAVEYGRRAANRAYRLGQFQEAATMLDGAQLCLLKLPESRLQQENRVDLYLEMVWPLLFLGDLDRALKICKEAESVARFFDDPVRMGIIEFNIGKCYFFKNQYDQAEQYDLTILQQPYKSEMAEIIATTKFTLAVTYFSTGQWEKAEDLYDEIIISREQSGTEFEHSDIFPFHPYTHSCHHLGYIRALQGRIKETKVLIRKGQTPAFKKISNLQSRAYCSLWHSAFSALVGEDFNVQERVDEVLEIAKKTDSPILLFLLYAAQGNAFMAVNNFQSASIAYKSSLQAIKGTAHRRYLEAVYHNLVEALLALEDFSSAKKYYLEALPLIPLNPKRNAALFDYLNGRLISSSNTPDFNKAEEAFQKSIKANEQAGAVVLATQTKYYLARMLTQKGEVERSRTILTEIRDLFKNWGVPFWQQKCDQALINIT